MTVPGGKSRVLGTNPIAYAAPTGTDRTVMLDIATSAVAATKIFAAKNEGREIPDTWLVDEDGIPTTDPTEFPEKGAQLPMAGHKGYGLAVLVELLTATLSGAAMMSSVQSWVADTDEPSNQGHAFVAIDVGAMMPLEEFHARMDAMCKEIKSASPAKGGTIFLPGEIEWNNREASASRGYCHARGCLDQPAGTSRRQWPRPCGFQSGLGLSSRFIPPRNTAPAPAPAATSRATRRPPPAMCRQRTPPTPPACAAAPDARLGWPPQTAPAR